MTDEEVEELIQECQPKARRLIQRHFADSAQVADALQEWSLAVWIMRARLDPQQNPQSFLMDQAKFVCLRIKQRYLGSQPLTRELDDSCEPATAQGGEHQALRDLDVRRAFDRLPSHLWIVAWLVHGEGFLVSETAKRLGLPRLLAEQRLAEATRLLQGMLKGWR